MISTQLDSEMRRFLQSLHDGGGSQGRKNLPPADRAEDRIRQRCRKAGLAIYKDGLWKLTEFGYSSLESS